MEIYPSEYQQLELNRYEKIFVRHASNDENYGLVLLKINPAMLSGEYLHAVIMSRGVVLCKFLPLTDASVFVNFIGPYMYGVFKNTVEIVGQKLKTNKALMLSRLVDTFFSRTSWTMLLYAENHSISVA